MSSTAGFLMTPRDLENEFNKVKDLLLAHLKEEGYVSGEDAEDLMLTRQVLLKKPSLISGLYNHILGKTADTRRFMIVKGRGQERE